MGPYVWCVIGIVLGGIAGTMAGNLGFVERVESAAVGVFGAFLGGEFVPAFVLKKETIGTGVNVATVSMAVAGAIVGLLLLGWMRRAVGPMKARKKKVRAC